MSAPPIARSTARRPAPRAARPHRSPTLALVVAVLLVLFPIYWMIITSLKLPREIYRMPSLWPQALHARTTTTS